MHFLEWLDRHFASNCHYYYADDLGCPLEFLPEATPPAADAQGQGGAIAPQFGANEHPPKPSAWQ